MGQIFNVLVFAQDDKRKAIRCKSKREVNIFLGVTGRHL